METRLISNTLGTMFSVSSGTVYAMAGNAIILLDKHREAAAALRSGAPVEAAVDEFLRFDGPAQGTTRVCMAPVTVGGVPISRGENLIVLLAAANRDESQFPAAERLVIGRRPDAHLAFAWGAHSCLGAIFGRAAIAALVRAVVELKGAELHV